MLSFPLFFCLSRAGRCLTVWSADCVSPPTSSNLIKACSSSLSSNNLLFTLLSLPFSFSFSHSRSSPYPVHYSLHSALDFGERTLKMRMWTLGSQGVTEKDAEQFHCVTLLSGDFNCFWFILMQNREREKDRHGGREGEGGGSLLPCFCLVLLSQALSDFTQEWKILW